MYKLIAIDVDGTLVTDNKKLTKKTIEMIQKAIKKGIKVVISSARSFYRLKNYLEPLDLIRKGQYTIAFNGAVIIENQSEEILTSKNFKKEEVKELIEIGKKLKTPISLYAMNYVITENKQSLVDINKHLKNVNFKEINFSECDFDKEIIFKIVFCNNPKDIIEIRKMLSKELFEKYEIRSSVPEYIEFAPKGITKLDALKKIMKKCNIKQSEVIAIGDADNDLEMINHAGLGVAMEKCNRYLKRTSKIYYNFK